MSNINKIYILLTPHAHMESFMQIAVMYKRAAFKANHLLPFQMSAIPPIRNKKTDFERKENIFM